MIRRSVRTTASYDEGPAFRPISKEHQAVDVELPPFVRDTATRFGTGVPYALKVLAGQLADDPDMGRPSNLPGILTVTVDGDLFEDCPALAVGYIRESDRIEIRYVNPISFTAPAEPVADAQDLEQQDEEPADPATEAVTVREIADAWQRITGWLQHNAPDSYAALRVGAGPTAIAALEGDLGIRIPVELHVLWLLTAGDDGVDGAGCLPGNRALMTLDAVAATYRLKMDSQAHQDTFNTDRPEDERITVWKATWVPVVALGPADGTSGLYLDAASGYMGRWSRYNEAPGEELDTLVTYLEEAADMLEAPALATRDRPGLIGGALVWLSSIDPAQEDRWQPCTG
ncbi:cell wall assembly regulator SMI1 [Streptomyces umbrinus]|uniref:Cell wall assembly regulator SMI1 n=1 Tax=Streptomyces umbrinus TaxID=67370 RepID=A0ABU0SH46_9ACTN|nr:cell wall assembly regulator SMI1 [Streptomyces umbrinus]